MELLLLKNLSGRSILHSSQFFKLIAAYLLRLDLADESKKIDWIKENFPAIKHKTKTILKLIKEFDEMEDEEISNEVSEAIQKITVLGYNHITIFAFVYLNSFSNKRQQRNIIPINHLANTINSISENQITHIEFNYSENKSLYPSLAADIFLEVFEEAIEKGKGILKEKDLDNKVRVCD